MSIKKFSWIKVQQQKTKMSGYKVFQCSAMDYHLEPARYEKIVMTKMMARYELRMNCDWISALQDALSDTMSSSSAIVVTVDPLVPTLNVPATVRPSEVIVPALDDAW